MYIVVGCHGPWDEVDRPVPRSRKPLGSRYWSSSFTVKLMSKTEIRISADAVICLRILCASALLSVFYYNPYESQCCKDALFTNYTTA